MTLDEFWDLIEVTKQPEARDHAAQLVRVLSERTVDDIFAFDYQFHVLHRAAYRWDLLGAAHIFICCGSDDGFIDFRTGLILRGRAVYEAVLANLDNLADVPSARRIHLEAYIGPKAYEARTGQDDYYDEWDHRFPPEPNPVPVEPAGENWDFDDKAEAHKRFPKLARKYGGDS